MEPHLSRPLEPPRSGLLLRPVKLCWILVPCDLLCVSLACFLLLFAEDLKFSPCDLYTIVTPSRDVPIHFKFAVDPPETVKIIAYMGMNPTHCNGQQLQTISERVIFLNRCYNVFIVNSE
ncbi:hypothetical protein NPIL_157621 [Nephila pilipes]|uniref:Uncharacterized protein n=1 Tax=Nephila pilipes TaxID=299642 RepID=A0A8X6QK65_NEPPI|nr:hypothetical protein NPIL_157621 [Nephila pilipes]